MLHVCVYSWVAWTEAARLLRTPLHIQAVECLVGWQLCAPTSRFQWREERKRVTPCWLTHLRNTPLWATSALSQVGGFIRLRLFGSDRLCQSFHLNYLITNYISCFLFLSVRSFISSPLPRCVDVIGDCRCLLSLLLSLLLLWCFPLWPSYCCIVMMPCWWLSLPWLVWCCRPRGGRVLAVGVAIQRKTGVAPGSLPANGKCQI